MDVRKIAEKDIKEDLRIMGKCFLAFHEELNPIMDKIVEEAQASKFKKGDVIIPIEKGKGFEEAIVLNSFISNEASTKGMKMYLLKILNGTATMLERSVDASYKLFKSEKGKKR